ncbi:MAG: CoA transferase subunit A [Burkholderiales bacterium]|nr:CoA transferase subunit A [Burkholderiales bacterium]
MSTSEVSASGAAPERARPGRKSKEISLEEAGRIVAQARVIHLMNSAMALVRAAIRARARGLTVIPQVTSSLSVDLLVAAGCVEKLYISYIGFESLGFAPAFRRAAEDKRIEIVEADEAFLMLGTRAAAGGMPYVPIRHVYEATDLPRLNPLLKKARDPFSGEDVYAVPPLAGDVCLVHAQECDVHGNAQVWAGNQQEIDKAMASRLVIVSAERIVPVDRTRENVEKVTLPGYLVHGVVHAPFGAHPLVCARHYEPDTAHLQAYFDAHAKGQVGDYLERYVHGCRDEADYLERVGVRQVMGLMRNV